VSTPVLILGGFALVALIAFGVYSVLPKKAPPKTSILAERHPATTTESAESDPLASVSWSDIALQSDRSPFIPGVAAKSDATATSPPPGQPTPEQPPQGGSTGVPPAELPGPTGAPPQTLPGTTGAPPAGGGPQPRSGPGMGGPQGLPVTPPTPGTMGPPPQQQQPAPQPTRLDRTNAFFREFYPRSEDSPIRPRRDGAGTLGGMALAGTVIGSDGRPTGIVTDGETRRLVRPGQQWTVAGRTVTVVSVDRGRVVLRDERGETIILQADGGATQ